MHTIWKGSISFGLVNIPIKLHAATENKDVKLRNLHKDCHAPIKYEKTCSECGKEISNEEIVKAYEYTEGKYVVLDDEELEKLKKEQEDKAVEIIDFVMLDEIDPIYFDRTYYVSPNEGGSKAYALLRKSLQETDKIGLAKITIRSKENLAAIRVYGNTIVMETLHFPDEVRDVKNVPNIPNEAEFQKNELETAKTLIDHLTAEFDPSKYTDEYRVELLELIREKVEEDQGVTKQEQTNVIDLMQALEKSIEKAKPSKTTKKTTTKTKTKTTAKPKVTKNPEKQAK
ncbi:Ku protein [Evansella cellulosilytica]|uniref:Non-homologous end joining protein Ku n=1 Tax=Evansella cellulosilytica (strain ATCC 21833 / DSM 2522 / FERM P-1141 / JCM 9156 / N-4) TaxID=649639 RepID=E6U0I9_EVAC2|nr:Ku protein [Evansella cellulosilytica]ADU31434.1 Ku protein [Evansella cellulosilytica DSM 2522]